MTKIWLRRLLGRSPALTFAHPSKKSRPRRGPLQLDALEERLAPAAPVNPSFEAGLSGWSIVGSESPAGIGSTIQAVAGGTSGSEQARLSVPPQSRTPFGWTGTTALLTSSNFQALANEQLSVDWQGVANGDAWVARGELHRSSDNALIATFFNQVGPNSFSSTPYQTATVTVPAADTYYVQFQGGTFDSTFGGFAGANLNVDNIRTNANPTAVSAGGPYTINEGSSLTLSATATSPIGAPLTYSWDVNGDGTFGDATGQNPTLSWAQLQALGITNGPTTRNVRVRVSDGVNTTTSAPVLLTVNNVVPAVTLSSNTANTAFNGPVNFTGSFNDPSGPFDTYTATVNYGDGTGAHPLALSGNTFSFTHTFFHSGSNSVVVTVSDGFGSGSSAPDPIAVAAPTTVYVDGNWAGLPYGTNTSSGPSDPAFPFGHFFGSNGTGVGDAFASVQAGVNAVAPGGTVVIYGPAGTYAENVALNQNVSLQAQGAVNVDTLTSGAAVTANLQGTFNAVAGAATFNGPVTLSGPLTIGSSGPGAGVTFGSTVESPGTAYALNVNTAGPTTFLGAVGGNGNPLAGLTTDAGGSTDLNGGSATTTGTQHYGDAVLLSADTTLTTTAGGNVQFDSTVDSTGASHSLTLNTGAGNILASGTLGGGLALSSLAVTSANNAAILGALHTLGDVTQTAGTGTTTISGTTGAGIGGNLNLTTANVTVNGANTVAGQVTFTASGTGTLNGTISAGSNTVSLNGGGTYSFFGANRFSSLTNPVTLAAATTLDLNGFSQTFGSLTGAASSLVKLTVNGFGTPTLTTGSAGSTTYAGLMTGGGNLTKVGASKLTLTNALTYTGVTTINGGTLLLTGSLTGAGGNVFLSANGVILDGGGSGQITGRGVTVAAGVTNGLVQNLKAVQNPGGTGVFLDTGSSARVLNDTITGNLIGIDVKGATAFIQGDNLNFNVSAGSDGVSHAAGLRARNGAVVDAGQKSGGFDFTGLGGGGVGQGSTGGNTFLGYTPATGAAVPTVPQAILDLNVDNVAGPRGEPNDLMAQNNTFGDNVGNSYGPQAPDAGSFTKIENLVFHDVDASKYGFINYVTPTSIQPKLLTQTPRLYDQNRNADPTFKQRSMIAHVELAFDNFVFIGSTGLTVNRQAPTVSIPTGDGYVGAIGTTMSSVSFDVATGEFRTSMSFTGGNGLDVSGSLEDGQYKLHLDATQIQAFIGAPVLPALELSGGTADLKFWRLYGDSLGLGYISTGANSDQSIFTASYGSHSGQANYHDYLDYDDTLQIGAAALFQYRRRLNFYTPGHSIAF